MPPVRRANGRICPGSTKAEDGLRKTEVVGDNINVMLAAAGYNFKRLLRKLKHFLLDFLRPVFARNTEQTAPKIDF